MPHLDAAATAPCQKGVEAVGRPGGSVSLYYSPGEAVACRLQHSRQATCARPASQACAKPPCVQEAPRLDTVYLDEVKDGFEFQEVCADIFRRLGWGKVETFTTQDKGRDINIVTTEGSIVVECKHQPGSTIGRPIVQKLHSATISFGGIKGMVVTSGKFSDEAIEHARNLSKTTPIVLVGWHELRKLAHKAGIALHKSAEGASPVIYGYRVDTTAMRQETLDSLARYQSRPRKIGDLAKIVQWSWEPRFAYRVKYDLVQTFRSSTYTLKEIKKYGHVIMVDGSGTRMTGSKVHDFVSRAPLEDFDKIVSGGGMGNIGDARGMSDNFTIPRHEVSNIAEDIIIDDNTSVIKYRGKNNVTYKKLCRPSRKSVRIADIRQVVIATYAIKVSVLGREITRKVINNTETTKFIDGGIRCETCSKPIVDDARRGGQACNACGRLTHARRMFRSCGFSCKACKKTICPGCTTSKRRMLLFKRRLCGECAGASHE